MAAGADAGAHLVVLDDAVRPAGLLAGESGLVLNWRVGPSGAELSAANFSDHRRNRRREGAAAAVAGPPSRRGLHGAGDRQMLSWIRRGRIDADSWTPSEIPLGEEREEYRIEIAHAGGAVVRTETVPHDEFHLRQAPISAADFGAPPAEIDVTVRQLSVAVGWGIPGNAAPRAFVTPTFPCSTQEDKNDRDQTLVSFAHDLGVADHHRRPPPAAFSACRSPASTIRR